MKKLFKAFIFATLAIAIVLLIGLLRFVLESIGFTENWATITSWFVSLTILYLFIGVNEKENSDGDKNKV